MKIASIVLNHFKGELKGDVFGVDFGAWLCLNNNITMKAACGDFDSVSISQRKAVFSLDIPIHVLPEKKDMTDFEFALSLCDNYDQIFVFGGLGGRRDHEYLNVQFATKDERIILCDELNRIQKIGTGEYTIKKDTFKYLSFIPLEASSISIQGVKYPLGKRYVSVGDAYLGSNEILEKNCDVIVHNGSLLMIQSNDA